MTHGAQRPAAASRAMPLMEPIKSPPPEAASAWELRYTGWEPREEPVRETMTTLGNGYFATRGAAEGARADGVHYPGTYVAGGYDRAQSDVAERTVENEDLVNWPNWLPLTFRVPGEPWMTFEAGEVLEYEQCLNVYRGLMTRRIRWRDGAGRRWDLRSTRLVHMGDPHTAAIDWRLTPLNWSGTIEVRSAIDGEVQNAGVARYRDLASAHVEIVDQAILGDDAILLVSRSAQSHVVVAHAVRTRLYESGREARADRRERMDERSVALEFIVRCERGRPLRVEKVLSLFTSMDFAISEPRQHACTHVARTPAFDAVRESHERAWRHLWHRADLELETENHYPQLVLRLHVFHLLQTVSMHSVDRDVGIPARGLHGEAYRGHVFWDELFVFPFFNLRMPELTRSLLMYRYRRLGEARHAAAAAGLVGAMFPWQSGSDGREESQVLHLNPESGRWIDDATHLQRHVNAAIVYDVWQYYQATGDLEFLSFYGAEILAEIARFWASLATYDARRGRYVIRGVVGPDEFHTRYPNAERPGLDNNAYTNVMAAWSLKTARAALELLVDDTRNELLERLGVRADDLERWDDVSRRMFVPFQAGGIISQFEGWERLEELDWVRLRQAHGEVQRLDRILEAQGDDPNRYKAAKQADALMLFYLFSTEELTELFAHLGYDFSGDAIPANVRYYLGRTSHGSTLSGVVHAWLLARTDRRKSWHLFRQALASDVEDVQGGTTAEGIHVGAMAGTVDLMQRCYTGIEMRHEVLWLNPRLPDELRRLRFTVRYRGRWIGLDFTRDELRVRFLKGHPSPARIGFGRLVHELQLGEERVFPLKQLEAPT